MNASVDPLMLMERGGGMERPYRAIDVHAHFFNAADVPVKDFIGRCVGHSASPFLRPMLKALSGLADDIAGIAPTAREEIHSLRLLTCRLRGLSARQVEDELRQEANADTQRAARDLAAILRNSNLERAYRRAKEEEARLVGPSASPPRALTEDELVRIAGADAEPRPAASRREVKGSATGLFAPYPDGLIAFAVYMCCLRRSNLWLYRRAYTVHQEAFGIDQVLAALVDFDYSLDCPPRSAHEDQIALHLAMARSWPGYFKVLVAYNPMTDVREKGACLARLIEAWKDPNVVGVKIYPPVGFKPTGNANECVNQVLQLFFETCAEKDIPIMAHTSQSMGVDYDHDEFSSWVEWERLLKDWSATTQRPVLTAGHFGGNSAGGSPANDWTRQFAIIMSRPFGSRLYGDLGYWEGLHHCPSVGSPCVDAKARLADALKVSNGVVADRVMFGSDWLMLSQVPLWAEYPHRVAEALPAGLDAAAVFDTNAGRCFSKLTTA
jgi:hypothetical protein